jgi:hypothetical protein
MANNSNSGIRTGAAIIVALILTAAFVAALIFSTESNNQPGEANRLSGVTGATGQIVVTGVTGLAGATGETVLTEETGMAGATGQTVVTGVTGLAGATGETVLTEVTGATGEP